MYMQQPPPPMYAQQQPPPRYVQQQQPQVVIMSQGGSKCIGCARDVNFEVESGLNDSACLCCIVWSIIGTPILGVICCLMQTEKKRVCPSCGASNGRL